MTETEKQQILNWLQEHHDEVWDKATSYKTNAKDLGRYQAEARIYSKVMDYIANREPTC